MPRPVLMTGFLDFGLLRPNPSFAALELAHKRGMLPQNVVIGALPTVWGRSTERFRDLIAASTPAKVLSLGVGNALGPIFKWERVGINRRTTSSADAAGQIADGDKIDGDGPPSFTTNLFMPAGESLFAGTRSQLTLSDDAGSFLCNDLIYNGARFLQDHAIPFGFIHVPIMREISDELKEEILKFFRNQRQQPQLSLEEIFAEKQTLTLDELADAIAKIAHAIAA